MNKINNLSFENIYDFNFEESFKIIKDKKILENKIQILRQTCDKSVVNEIENIVIFVFLGLFQGFLDEIDGFLRLRGNFHN